MKRFYKSAGTARQGDRHAVTLDGKVMRTPGGNAVALRAKRLAAAVAEEWQAQRVEIDMDSMPLTKLVYAAIDGASRRAEIAAHILKFARSDLVCYRAAEPQAL